MQLIRLQPNDSDGHTFEALYIQWAKQISTYGDSIEEFAKPYLDHARQISSEVPPDKNYGIYALEKAGDYFAFMHLNWAQIPGIKDWTVRINWIQTCPRYEYDELTPEFVAHAVASILNNVDLLVKSDARHCGLVKIRVGNAYDRSFWSNYSALLGEGRIIPGATSYKMAGMWMHITY